MMDEENEYGKEHPVTTNGNGSNHTTPGDDDEPNGNIDEALALAEATSHVSHFKNTAAHPAYVRYGVPIFLVCILILLINSYIGSGVSAEYILLRDGVIQEQRELLVASIFSSVHELWLNESYPLAILIVITSISWPFVKIFISLYVWLVPYTKPRRREFIMELIDAIGKWSFVDIVVFVEIMVAFRSSILIAPSVTLEIVVVAKWGFYGFVLATMLSLLSSHYILHRHRKVHYHDLISEKSESDSESKKGMKAKGGLSNTFMLLAMLAVAVSLVFYLVGCVMDTFQVSNTRGEVNFTVDYSVTSVGLAIPESQLEPNDIGTRFIQFMWFFLCVAMPLWCSFLFGVLFIYPFSKVWLERIFFMGEIAFAWSCAEVLLVSTIFSVLQMPTFGDGLIEADCTACFVVDTKILSNFAFLCIGSVLSVTINVWLYRKAHSIVYGIA